MYPVNSWGTMYPGNENCTVPTPGQQHGFSKEIQCHVRSYSFLLQITRADIRPQVKWTVSLLIANDLFNLPQGFEWVDLCFRYVYIDSDNANVIMGMH